MPTTLTLPKLSPTMEDGTITLWHKKPGDFVEAGDLLLEIATDKATIEYNALDSGWLRKILVKEQESAAVNEPIAILTETETESIEDFHVKTISKQVEAKMESDEKRDSQDNIKPKEVIYRGSSFQPEPPLTNYQFKYEKKFQERVKASPLAKKLAKEKGLDITSLKGSGPQGRIQVADLDHAPIDSGYSFGHPELPVEVAGSFKEEALTPIRKVIAARLQEAKSFIPHFYVQQMINADALVDFRDELSSLGVKVSYNDCIIRACALALKKYPNINSGFNGVNNTIVRFKTVDISVAVSIPDGLLTPIIRHADFKNLSEISAEMRDLAKRAKEGKLQGEEYKGGSFTISNMGMYGISGFQAIINPPQAAILAVSGISDQPVIKNKMVVPGKVLNICLSVDHRVIDGQAAALFIKTVQQYLEHPIVLVL